VDGGARVLGADVGGIDPPKPPPAQNEWEAAASRRIRDDYMPECTEMKTWLVGLQDSFNVLRFGLLDYAVQHKARLRMLDPNAWLREVDLHPIMTTVLDFVFLEKIGKEPFDFDAIIVPKLRDLGVPMDVGLPLVHEVVMHVMSAIGAIFPEMYFGTDVRISYEMVGSNDLWISTSKDYPD
jgi:hypothetical protein